MEESIYISRNKRWKVMRKNFPKSIIIYFRIFLILNLFLHQSSNGQSTLKDGNQIIEEAPVNTLDKELYGLSPENFYSQSSNITIKFFLHDLTLALNDKRNLTYKISSGAEDKKIVVFYNFTTLGIVSSKPNETLTLKNVSQSFQICLNAKDRGHTVMFINASHETMFVDTSSAFARISVRYSASLDYLSDVIGWLYFAAWSVSFYPQIILNYKRKSVIGMHFDFLALNTIGFFVYAIFNTGFYWIPTIQEEYNELHPHGINPVQLNDVIFALHAFFACALLVAQCSVYDRGDQRISQTTRTLIGCFIISAIIMLIMSSTTVISWINFLYFLSYIKLFITLIKYIPQAYYNYLRKSTSGWSIGNILLDFTGGALSIGQMFILSYNYNDWGSIFGDPTKFGLGLFSIVFDIFFMLQHYVWYKSLTNYQELSDPIMDSHHSSLTSSLRSSNSAHYGAT